MPRNCMVAFCKNRGTHRGLRYFRVTQSRREAWLRAIGRNLHDGLSQECSICSDHFNSEDFQRKGNVQVLKASAVPSQKLKPINIQRHLISIKKGSKPHTEIHTGTGDDSVSALPNSPSCQELSNPQPHQLKNEPSDWEENINVVNESSVYDHKENMGASDSCGSTSSSTSSNNSTPDSEGLIGSPKKRRALFKMMHNYCKSPRKLAQQVNDLQDKNKQLKGNLRAEKMRTSRLKKRVERLQVIIKELRKHQRAPENARVLEN